MSSDLTFEGIADAGRAIVEAHKKKEGFEEGIRRLLSELYPDNAHFIYELLQNAEDAKATVVEFELRSNALEVRHNGSRAFSLKDIDSIANIGNSTKRDDETQIGKFGVGFKAVYSYTTRPEIRSGEFSFAIRDLFVPEPIYGSSRDGWTTFLFPFDRDEKPAELACLEIERGLRDLDEKTLLFLNNIHEITYELPSRDIGFVKREDLDDLTIRIEASQGVEFFDSTWLRLIGPASTSHGGQSTLSVAAAFKLEPKTTGKGRPTTKPGVTGAPLGIVPLPEGDVSIYFPAASVTSGLKFHIHAPFASTVARDSVRDVPENTQLVADIGSLIVSHLKGFRDRGLIDEGFLSTLPNTGDALKPIYGQIESAVVEAFNDGALTPVRGGDGHGRARSLVSSPTEFRTGLDEADLRYLLEVRGAVSEEEPRWVREFDGRAGRFVRDLDTRDFGWSELNTALSAVEDAVQAESDDYSDNYSDVPLAEVVRAWHRWLEAKDDGKLLKLYELLAQDSDGELWVDLEEIPIVRLRAKGGTTHVKGPDTYLPATRGDTVKSRVPAELAYFDDDEDTKLSNNLRSFYGAAGVRRWDARAKIDRRLAAYRSNDFPELDDGAPSSKHLDDMRAFIGFGLADPSAARSMFRNMNIVLVVDDDGDLAWATAGELYIDEPFRTTGFSALYANNPGKYPLPGFYLEIEGIDDFLASLGATSEIEVKAVSVFQNPQLKYDWWSGRKHSHYTVASDWRIENLDSIAATADPTLLHTLWETVVDLNDTKASAVYQANRSAGRHVFASRLQQELAAAAWVLDRDGEVRRPSDMALDEIREGWRQPAEDSLVHKLGFGAQAAQQEAREAAKPHLAEQLGIELEDAELIKEAREAGIDIEAALHDLIAQKRSQEAFPDGASENPDRRALVVALDATTAAIHQTEIRSRSVVVGQGPSSEEARAYLREQYANPAGDMYCQACHSILPFKVKGEWYFEATQFVGNRNRTHRQNALALCPLCAATYKYARETSDNALLESLSGLEVGAGQGAIEVPVLLNGQVIRLRLTGKHALDLQSAMAVAGEERE